MSSGWMRRGRAWIVSGMVATAVVVAGAGPAPGQAPEGPEVSYVEGYGPMRFAYEDCDGVIHTEDEDLGWVYIELDGTVEADTSVAIELTGDIEDHLVAPPTAIEVPAGEDWGEASFALDELVAGELTVTVLPGVGYVADQQDTSTFEVTDETEVVLSCLDDLGTPPGGTDRQTIDVGEKPEPIGFFDDFEDDDGACCVGGETTTTSGTGEEELTAGFRRVREQRAAPQGYSTPVVGDLPPGLTYEDDVWSGAATTAGTYDFDIRVCFDQGAVTFGAGRTGSVRRPAARALPQVICFGSVDVEVVVRAVTPPTPPPATPARPVTAPARFAG